MRSYTTTKLEASLSLQQTILPRLTVITYEIVVEGRLHEVLKHKGKLLAYIKVIDPEAAQFARSHKIAVSKFKVRLKDGRLVRPNGREVDADGSESVIAALQGAAAEEFLVECRLNFVRAGDLVGVLNEQLTDDIANPGAKPCVIMECTYTVTGSVSTRRRGLVWVAYDGVDFYEVIGRKRIVKLELPERDMALVRSKAKKCLVEYGREF